MTDLQRHLKGIHKVLVSTLERTPVSESLDLAQVRADLRVLLPQSYGIATGRIEGQDVSQPVPILLYNAPQSQGCYTETSTTYRIEHILGVIDVARSYTPESLRQTLDMAASVKRLQTFRSRHSKNTPPPLPSQARLTIPRDRLPFTWLMADHFEPVRESLLYDELHALLAAHEVAHRPDVIDLLSQQTQYRNPLLESETARPTDMGWSLLPRRRKPEDCYICKQEFMTRHFFYSTMCQRCGDLNYQKRREMADLRGYCVLVTGARVKIGYATALRLLRAGAEVIATSRFPRDAARRFSQEADFEQWQGRLHVYGVDFRSGASLERFIQHLYTRYSHLDALINNAAQTVKRPLAFYAHLLPYEITPLAELPPAVQSVLPEHSLASSGVFDEALALSDPAFPPHVYDEDGQQMDYRDFNSWVMRLEDVPISEMIEVHLVNAVAPAILAGQLKPLLKQSPHAARFVLNVSAAEGRFNQRKTGYHPHTNMAKAALNMLTRTIAEEYAEEGIYVNSVDPGWVSDQVPHTGEMSRLANRELLPLDMIDAAARVCDPIFTTLNTGKAQYGLLWKDYEIATW